MSNKTTEPTVANVTWYGSTSKPPVCVGCGKPILPMSLGPREAPSIQMHFTGGNGPYHIGCPHD